MGKRKRNYEVMLDLGDGLCVCKGDIDSMREQDLNARSMPPEMFKQLAANIEKRQGLESLPLLAETEKGIEIVSGHHRVRAARAAEVTTIFFLLDRSGLTRDQIIAKQLAHNSIEGTDDPQILKELFEQIYDAEARIASFIDPKSLGIDCFEQVKIGDIETDIQFKQISFLFLAHQLEAFDDAANEIDKDTEMVGIADLEQYEKVKEAIHKVREVDDIRAVGMIMSRMCDIVMEYYDERDEAGILGSTEERDE
jgi:hypothetical protein